MYLWKDHSPKQIDTAAKKENLSEEHCEEIIKAGQQAAPIANALVLVQKAEMARLHGYYRHHYVSSFVGMAPASHPRLVVAVVVRDPKGQHFGAMVAAPVFSKVMSGALRLLDIPPDNIKNTRNPSGIVPLVPAKAK